MTATARLISAGKIVHPRDLIPAMADWLWECDGDGRLSFLSPEFEESAGLSPQALLGQRLAELAFGASGAHGAEPPRAAIEGLKPFRDVVFKLDGTSGGGTWVEIAGTPVIDAAGFQGYWGIGKIVTAEIRKNLQLQRDRQLFDMAADWFWEMDTHNRLTYVSPNIEAVLGLPTSVYYGKYLSDTEGVTIDPDSGRAALAAIKARQPYRDFIYSRKLPDGRIVWVSSNGAPFYERDGSFVGYRGIARDITAQIEAERSMRESETRFRDLFQISADYYWEQDAEHRLIYVSPEALHDELHGAPVAEEYGKRITDNLKVSFDPESARKSMKAVKARQAYRDVVFSIRHPNGRRRWLSICAAPKFDESGNYCGYRGTGVEVTQRIEEDAAARLAQRQLHDAIIHVSQPFAVFDAQERVVAFNQAFVDLYRKATVNTAVFNGVSYRAIIDWQFANDFYAEGPDEQAVDAAMLVDDYQGEREQTFHLSDGRWMLVAYRRLPGDGKMVLWTDITAIKHAEAERRALEVQLHHSQRLEALGTLAGGAAHEINNALVPVLSLAKLAARKQPEGSRERRNLEMMFAGAERASSFVAQILAFSRKESEERPMQRLDLATVLGEALELARATVPTSIRLVEEIEPVAAVTGDPNQLLQVIVNMVTNAAQAIGAAQGSITVTLRPETDGSQLRLSVADTGCGMDETTAARVFEPFFTTKPVGEGSGLGLSVAHGIVKTHGGRIEVTSTPGQGSRFDIVMPAAPAAAVKAA